MQDAAEVQGRITDMLGLLRDGRLVVDVERVLPLESAREAHTMLESRATAGKLLLKPAA